MTDMIPASGNHSRRGGNTLLESGRETTRSDHDRPVDIVA